MDRLRKDSRALRDRSPLRPGSSSPPATELTPASFPGLAAATRTTATAISSLRPMAAAFSATAATAAAGYSSLRREPRNQAPSMATSFRPRRARKPQGNGSPTLRSARRRSPRATSRRPRPRSNATRASWRNGGWPTVPAYAMKPGSHGEPRSRSCIGGLRSAAISSGRASPTNTMRRLTPSRAEIPVAPRSAADRHHRPRPPST